jgi:hypothetical protein
VAFFLSSAFSCINSRTWPSHHKASSLQIFSYFWKWLWHSWSATSLF